MEQILQNSTEISIQGLVAVIALVSAVVSAVVSGIMQIITKIIENKATKTQMEITNKHEIDIMREKNSQEAKMKKWDTYHAEEKEAFRKFVEYGTLLYSSESKQDENYANMIKYMNFSLIYGDEGLKQAIKDFLRYGDEKASILRYRDTTKKDFNRVIDEINRILKNSAEL